MKYRSLDLARTRDLITRRRPVLRPVLELFSPILELQEQLASEFAETLQQAGGKLPVFRRENSLAGLPLLSGYKLDALLPLLQVSAEKILPVLLKFPPLAPHEVGIKGCFLDNANELQSLFESMLLGDDSHTIMIADRRHIPTEVLRFAADYVFSPVLHGMTGNLWQKDDEFPWNEEGLWSQGYCPVCGSLPSLAWLDRPVIEEKNAFLVGGGGKKNFHCALCGASWHFRRGVCPSCGSEGDGTMEILKESGSHGERIDFCAKCHVYCPTVDLREFADVPQMDMMALGMIHLDMIAAEKRLRPLKQAFWNSF